MFKMSDADLSQDLALLEKIVNMPSETNDIGGVTAVAKVLADEFQKLGFQMNAFVNPNVDPMTKAPISADLIVGELKGTSSRFINIIVHADTVFKALADGTVPTPFKIVDSVQRDVQIAIAGKRILGSGVGDDKGGTIVALRGLKMYLAQGKPKYSLRVIISTNEESGSPGHQITMAKFSPDAVAVLGLEPSGGGHVLRGRGGVHWYEVKVTGVEAHARVWHERGVNACLDLSLKLAKASELTDYGRNLTVSVGTIAGGKRANIVCGEATAIVDTRFADPAMDQAIEANFQSIFMKPEVSSHDGAGRQSTTVMKTVAHMGAFIAPAASDALRQHVIDRIQQIDSFAASANYSRGGADISMFDTPNAVMIDGLGPVTDGSHTPDEYILLETMRSRALIFADLLENIP